MEFLTTAVLFYLFIGIAHWCNHIKDCPGCRGWAAGGIGFIMEGFVHTLGWPTRFVGWFLATLKWAIHGEDPESIKAKAESQVIGSAVTATLLRDGKEPFVFTKSPDESLDTFLTRCKLEGEKLLKADKEEK